MPQSQVIEVMTGFKAQLLARELSQMRQMAEAWIGVQDALEAQISALAQEFARFSGQGQAPNRRQLLDMDRYQRLLTQLHRELMHYTDYAENLITGQQLELGKLGIQHAMVAIDASITEQIGPMITRLPISAVENMVGLAGDGSPIRQLLVDSWPDAVDGLTNALIRSTALGINPRETALRMRDATGGSLDRMLTVARSEQLRVYKEASRLSYINSGVVSAYKRLATRDSRSCAGCLAADGREYGLNQSFASHPNCRCSLIPVVIGQESPKPAETTEAWFSRQSPETQSDILGVGKYDLWSSGKVSFSDFAVTRHDNTWGDAIVPATLQELVGQ
jgi:SPP1 gp7 family putative phage head morphogenesis protein